MHTCGTHVWQKMCTLFIRLKVAKLKMLPGMSRAAHIQMYHYQLCHK